MSQNTRSQPGNTKKTTATERDTFAALAFCWADMVVKTDADLAIVFASGATSHFTGMTPETLTGRRLIDIVEADDARQVRDAVMAARGKARVTREPVRVRRPSGINANARVSAYAPESAAVFYLAFQKISAREELRADGQKRDPVSGLLDAATFAEAAAEHVSKGPQYGEDAAISLIELADFERLANVLPPANRAAMLRKIGEVLRVAAIDGISATQAGNGRFSIVHDADADLTQLEASIAAITRHADPAGRGSDIQHVRVAADHGECVDEGELTRGLLYMLNRFGHAAGSSSNLRSLSRSMSELADQAVAEVRDFKRMVRETRFHLAFQPIVAADNGDIHHYEALCRFTSSASDRSPARRIAFAEETGMIHDLDLAVVRAAIDWLSTRSDRDSITIAVNISGQSVENEAWTRTLCDLLANSPVAHGRLAFEITESAGMADLRRANRFIRTLRERGYPVALDDLGAGAASFRYLSALEVDMVKIDGTAIRHARTARKGRAFLTALAELCHRLGTASVAEMIDDEAGLQFARDCGVDYVQGYLFGQPSANLQDFSPLRNVTLFQRYRRVA
jgi:PAS domain S-box-containing protein